MNNIYSKEKKAVSAQDFEKAAVYREFKPGKLSEEIELLKKECWVLHKIICIVTEEGYWVMRC